MRQQQNRAQPGPTPPPPKTVLTGQENVNDLHEAETFAMFAHAQGVRITGITPALSKGWTVTFIHEVMGYHPSDDIPLTEVID